MRFGISNFFGSPEKCLYFMNFVSEMGSTILGVALLTTALLRVPPETGYAQEE